MQLTYIDVTTHLRRGLVLAALGAFITLPGCATDTTEAADDDGPPSAQAENDDGEAAESSEAALSGCVHNVGYTIRQGSYVKGSGSMSSCTRVKVWLERRRPGGSWSGAIDPRYCTWSGCAITTQQYCSGGTTYEYRTGVAAQHSGGVWTYTKYSNVLRTTC